MAEMAGALTTVAVFVAIIYSFAKATLTPIHEKLDRILALQELSLESKARTMPSAPADDSHVRDAI